MLDPGFLHRRFRAVEGARVVPSGGRSPENAATLRRFESPRVAHEVLPAPDGPTLALMVLEALLEVEDGAGFAAGAAAAHLVFAGWNESGAPEVPDLTGRALLHGAACASLPTEALAGRLYDFNREPATPWLRRRLGAPGGVRAFLDPDGAASLAEHPAVPAWLFRRRPGPDRPGEHKVYVSPCLTDTPRCLRAVAEAFQAVGGFDYKVGRTLGEILRPDRIVLHVDDEERCRALASWLVGRLDGVRALGVPFSCAVDESGLVSLGVDPVHEASTTDPTESWRGLVTARAAVAIKESFPFDRDPWRAARYVRAKLALEGIDTVRWLPAT